MDPWQGESLNQKTSDLRLRCTCGKFAGEIKNVSRVRGFRGICLCDDCQAYAHHLDRAKEILDANGGSEIFGAAPSHIKITQGSDLLQCVRLSDKGMLRWFTSCCRTPIANSMPSSRMPFAGVFLLAVDPTHSKSEKDRLLGPIAGRVQGKYGIAPLPPGTSRSAPLRLIAGTMLFLVRGILFGRSKPSPFFKADGSPVVSPKILTEAERRYLEKYCGPKPTLGPFA